MTESTRHMEFAPKRPRLVPRVNPNAVARLKEAAEKKAAEDASTAVALAAAQAAAALLLGPTVVEPPPKTAVGIVDNKDDEPVAGPSA